MNDELHPILTTHPAWQDYLARAEAHRATKPKPPKWKSKLSFSDVNANTGAAHAYHAGTAAIRERRRELLAAMADTVEPAADRRQHELLGQVREVLDGVVPELERLAQTVKEVRRAAGASIRTERITVETVARAAATVTSLLDPDGVLDPDDIPVRPSVQQAVDAMAL